MKLSFRRSFNFSSQAVSRGFTLLELLVVVALIGVLASIALVAFDKTRDRAEVDVARIEMTEIRKALHMFHRDVGHDPSAVTEDLSLWLLSSCQADNMAANDYDDGCAQWDPDARRGWNGPYMNAETGTQANAAATFDGLLDPWGNYYRLVAPDTADTRIESNGPDKQAGSTDDIFIYLRK